MNEDMKNEAIEMITTACEKYAQNYELAAKTIKEAMDKKYVGGSVFCSVNSLTRELFFLQIRDFLARLCWRRIWI